MCPHYPISNVLINWNFAQELPFIIMVGLNLGHWLKLFESCFNFNTNNLMYKIYLLISYCKFQVLAGYEHVDETSFELLAVL